MSNERVQGYARIAASQRADRWRARCEQARAEVAALRAQLAENAGEQKHPVWTNREQSPLSEYIIEIWHPEVHRQFGEDECPWCDR